jgi:hypothetical protein
MSQLLDSLELPVPLLEAVEGLVYSLGSCFDSYPVSHLRLVLWWRGQPTAAQPCLPLGAGSSVWTYLQLSLWGQAWMMTKEREGYFLSSECHLTHHFSLSLRWTAVRMWFFCLFVCFPFLDRVSLCSPGWHWTVDPPGSVSPVLGLQAPT